MAQEITVKLSPDWQLLREQKSELLNAINTGKLSPKMEGLLHFIDDIQDQAVDSGQVPNGEVFS